MFKHPLKITVFFYLCLPVVPIVTIAQSRVIDLDAWDENIRIIADDIDDHVGMYVTRGDINGDGYDDLIIGA
jgi:hypothetical protein